MSAKGQKRLSAEQRAELVRLAGDGVEHQSLAATFGIQVRQVARIIFAATPPEERGMAKIYQRQVYGAEEALERPFAEVAKELGVDRKTVWRWKQKLLALQSSQRD